MAKNSCVVNDYSRAKTITHYKNEICKTCETEHRISVRATPLQPVTPSKTENTAKHTGFDNFPLLVICM